MSMLSQLISLSKTPVFIPMYHGVSDINLEFLNGLYRLKTTKTFEEELDFILKHYQPIGIDELITHTKSDKKNQKPFVHFTFDDGLACCYETVFPILQRKGIPASFFITSDWVDNRNMFFRHQQVLEKQYNDAGFDAKNYLKTHQPYLTSEQIKSMHQEGFSFGGHSLSHPYFQKISLEKQMEECAKSMDFIQNLLQLDYRIFSFPFSDSDISKAFFQEIESQTDLTFGMHGLRRDEIPWHLHRLDMETHQSIDKYLTKKYLNNLGRMILGNERVKRKDGN